MPTARSLEVAFEEFDLDHSGDLDTRELLAILQRPGTGSTMTEADAQEFCALFDKDGDGKLSLSEFVEAWEALGFEDDEFDIKDESAPTGVRASTVCGTPLVQDMYHVAEKTGFSFIDKVLLQTSGAIVSASQACNRASTIRQRILAVGAAIQGAPLLEVEVVDNVPVVSVVSLSGEQKRLLATLRVGGADGIDQLAAASDAAVVERLKQAVARVVEALGEATARAAKTGPALSFSASGGWVSLAGYECRPEAPPVSVMEMRISEPAKYGAMLSEVVGGGETEQVGLITLAQLKERKRVRMVAAGVLAEDEALPDDDDDDDDEVPLDEADAASAADAKAKKKGAAEEGEEDAAGDGDGDGDDGGDGGDGGSKKMSYSQKLALKAQASAKAVKASASKAASAVAAQASSLAEVPNIDRYDRTSLSLPPPPSRVPTTPGPSLDDALVGRGQVPGLLRQPGGDTLARARDDPQAQAAEGAARC
jgi:hypothetical protein